MSDNTTSGAVRNGKIQAVIFDLDGLLMDSEWIGFGLAQELAARHGGQLDEALFPQIIGITAEETIEFIMKHAHVQMDMTESVAWLWEAFIAKLRNAVEPLPGAKALLQELYRCGYPLAIASNSPTDYVDNAMQGLGLGDFFPLRVCVDQVAQGKPAPDLYLRAAELLGVEPERCLALEDSRVGVQAAAAAGMRVLAIPGHRDHENGFDQAWQVYRSLEQVCTALDEVLA